MQAFTFFQLFNPYNVLIMTGNFTPAIFEKNSFSFRVIYSVIVFLILSIGINSGQSFLGLDGGFESSATIDNATTYSGAQVGKWVKAETSLSIAEETTTFRSGTKALKISMTNTNVSRVWSPLYTIPASTSRFYVQYYRRSASVTNTVTQKLGCVRGGTELDNNTYFAGSVTDTWEKVKYSPTSQVEVTTIAGLILPKAIGAGGEVFIDDFCIYADTQIDETAPTAPTAPVIGSQNSNNLTVSWTAASGGVDGGGYLVVRGTSDPSTAPNVNGIYATGNSIGSGVVVYQGTNTSFTDNSLTPGTTYYYRIYTYDKAYNYSTAITVNGTTVMPAPAANNASGISSTGFTANWDATSGATGYKIDVATSTNFNDNIVIASESFENSMTLFTQTTNSGTYYTGTSASNDSPSSTLLSSNGTYGYGISTGTVTITSNAINTTSYSNIQLSFKAASINGADVAEIIAVEISPDGSNFFSTLRILGYSNASWAYNATGIASTAYDGNATPVDFQPPAGGLRTTDGYSTVVVNSLPATTNLKVRITLSNNQNGELWVIDDFKVTGNYSTNLSGYNNLSVSGNSQEVTGLSPNSTYYYRVRAVGANTTSSNSNTITVTTSQLSAPTATAATAVTSTSLTANTNTVSGATSYVIDLAYDEAFTNIVGFYSGFAMSGTTRIFNGLSPNTTYYYRVRATSTNSTSANSNIISVTTLASYNISVSSSDGAKGSVSGGGSKDAGVSVSLTATPASGLYRFVNWTEDGNFVSKDNPYNFTASAAKTLVANFADVASPIAITSTTNASTFADCATCNVTVSAGGQLTIDESKTFNLVTVAPGGQVSLSNGSTLTAPITLESNASGTATFVNENTGAQSITGTVQNYLAHTRNWYVSSPVSNAVAPAGYTFYQRDEAGASWTSKPFVQDSVFVRGRGYIALPGSSASTLTFEGTINHGNIPVYLTASGASSTGFNLIGNPYPAHLTWTKAFVDANAALIEPTIYYRTTSGTVNNATGWSFKSINANTGEVSPVGTTAVIPPMQAFWIKAKQTGVLTLNSSLTRSHETGNPLKAPANANADRKRLRLLVSNGDARTDETLIYFDPAASDSYDSYDSPRFDEANSVTQLYSLVDSKKLVINGLSGYAENTELPLGFVGGAAGTYQISATQFSNFESGVQVLLSDKNTGALVDLSSQSYTFNADALPDNNRFSVVFKAPGIATGMTEVAFSNIYVNAQNQLVINAPANSIYTVYNTLGQVIVNGKTTSNLQASNFNLMNGVYMVKVGNQTKKIIVK